MQIDNRSWYILKGALELCVLTKVAISYRTLTFYIFELVITKISITLKTKISLLIRWARIFNRCNIKDKDIEI